MAYTACTAPTSVTAANAAPSVGTTTTLNWSGAKAGTANAITGYIVYRSTSAGGTYSVLENVTSTSTAGSISVTAPSTMGSSYYYKVLTVGTVNGYNSAQSSAYATITAKVVTACTAPTVVEISPTTIDSGSAATLSWSGATAGTNNAITAY